MILFHLFHNNFRVRDSCWRPSDSGSASLKRDTWRHAFRELWLASFPDYGAAVKTGGVLYSSDVNNTED